MLPSALAGLVTTSGVAEQAFIGAYRGSLEVWRQDTLRDAVTLRDWAQRSDRGCDGGRMRQLFLDGDERRCARGWVRSRRSDGQTTTSSRSDSAGQPRPREISGAPCSAFAPADFCAFRATIRRPDDYSSGDSSMVYVPYPTSICQRCGNRFSARCVRHAANSGRVASPRSPTHNLPSLRQWIRKRRVLCWRALARVARRVRCAGLHGVGGGIGANIPDTSSAVGGVEGCTPPPPF